MKALPKLQQPANAPNTSALSLKGRFRLNVAAILRCPRGRILICERLGTPGAWQFPQGGVDRGESLDEALTRELEEEIGVTAEQWIEVRQGGPFRYHFGPGRRVKGFDGKDQHFFLLEYLGKPQAIRIDQPKPEFQAFRWIAPKTFSLEWVPEMKRQMYRDAFETLLGIRL